jgi:hypothetical protein
MTWLGIVITAYLLLLLFGLLFVKGASAKATPPITDASQPETQRNVGAADIAAAAVNSEILPSRDARASASFRRLAK